jgi:hypothetical protein
MFHKDYKEFIELLIARGAEYIVVGGHSVIANGYVRSTQDIDIWFRPTPENIDRILKCLTDLGVGSLGIKALIWCLKGA